MADPLLIAAWGLAVFSVLLTPVAYWLGGRHPPGSQPGLTFEEVCHAAARAKEERRQEEHLSRDYVDGADGVLAELLTDRDVTPKEMQTAYLAGGEEVELEP